VNNTVSTLKVGIFYHSIVYCDPVPQPMMFVNLEHTTLNSQKSLLLGQISRKVLPGHHVIRKDASQLFLVVEQAVECISWNFTECIIIRSEDRQGALPFERFYQISCDRCL